MYAYACETCVRASKAPAGLAQWPRLEVICMHVGARGSCRPGRRTCPSELCSVTFDMASTVARALLRHLESNTGQRRAVQKASFYAVAGHLNGQAEV